jgi:hypothetical protein
MAATSKSESMQLMQVQGNNMKVQYNKVQAEYNNISKHGTGAIHKPRVQ